MIQKLIALLFAAGEELSKKELATLCGVDILVVEESLPELREYAKNGGLSIIENGNELQLVTSAEQSELVTNLLKKDLEGELTPATLQVLTIIAYLDEVTRGDISFIRGVQSSSSIRTLTARGLITRNNELCTLTLNALRYLGIERVEDLPEYESIHKDLETKLYEAKQEL